jgi:hypothetical protein
LATADGRLTPHMESSSHPPSLVSATSAPREAPRYRFLGIAVPILLTFGLVQIRWGTVVPENGGLGFDGRLYAAMAQDLPGLISGGGLTPYSVQRIVPSAIVYCALSVAGVPKGTREVRLAFALYNLSLLILTAVIWERIGRQAGLGDRGLWLGFILLFINLANLRLPFHYAPLTDTTAFTLGALLVYFYLRGNRPGVLAVLVLGAFTWRSFLWLGSALFVLPRRPLEARTPSRPFSRVILLVGAVAYAASVSLYGLGLGPPGLVAVLSSSLVLAYFVIVASGLLRNPEILRPSTYGGMGSRLGILALAGGAVLGSMVLLLPDSATSASIGDLVGQLYPIRRFLLPRVGRAAAAPALFLVNSARYFGMAAPLLVFAWPRFGQATRRLGLGMTVYILVHLLLAANPESRQNIDGLTAIVLALVLAGEPHLWTSRYFAVVTAGALAISTVWFPGNYVGALGLQTQMERLARVYGSLSASPIAHPVFLRQALYVGALAVAAWLVSRPRPPARFSASSTSTEVAGGDERHFVTARDGNEASAGSD